MTFDQLLARADDETLQQLLGPAAVRLMMLLDRSLAAPTHLRRVLLELRGRAELLMAPDSRALLLDLLAPRDAENLALVLGIPAGGDVYAALRAARFAVRSARTAMLLQFFGLCAPISAPRDEPNARARCAPGYGLFAHQRGAARDVAGVLSGGGRRVLLHMPTGSGKTRTAMNIIADHLRAHEPALVIWLATSEELCEQAATEWERAWGALGNREVALHRFWGGHSLDLESARDGLLVAGLSKLYALAQGGIAPLSTLGTRASLIVIDEAHQAIAPTYKLLLDALFVLGEGGALLGLSATPGRTYSDVEADQQLADFFDCRKVGLHIAGYDNPVEYLVEAGFLARAQFESLFYSAGIELTPREWADIRDGLEIPDAILRKLADDEARNLALLAKIREMTRHHARIIVFAATVAHAHLLATVLRAQDVAAAAVSGDTPKSQRARIIAEFQGAGDTPQVLCNYGVLTTGFDAPRTSAAVIARPTKSLVLYSQMVGRSIRGPRAGGNASAEIVTVVDRQLPGFADVAQAFANWEDVWS